VPWLQRRCHSAAPVHPQQLEKWQRLLLNEEASFKAHFQDWNSADASFRLYRLYPFAKTDKPFFLVQLRFRKGKPADQLAPDMLRIWANRSGILWQPRMANIEMITGIPYGSSWWGARLTTRSMPWEILRAAQRHFDAAPQFQCAVKLHCPNDFTPHTKGKDVFCVSSTI